MLYWLRSGMERIWSGHDEPVPMKVEPPTLNQRVDNLEVHNKGLQAAICRHDEETFAGIFERLAKLEREVYG